MKHEIDNGDRIVFISVPLAEYSALQRDSILLNCLENAGVDNWDWYGDAYQEFEKIWEGNSTDE